MLYCESLVMQSLTLNQSAERDAVAEVARLESLLAERQAELTTLQTALHAFKARYAQTVGSRLAELAEIEQAIREAEARLGDGKETEPLGDESGASGDDAGATKAAGGGGLRKLFWSVAKLFHPDHAADDEEAKRRHSIMAEASRAYREGDVDSLHTLLGDEDLQFYCASTQAEDNPGDLRTRLFSLKEELRTVEFGIKRAKQDGLYRTMLRAESEAVNGRDALVAESERIARQIVKARHRLTNLT